MKNVLLVSLYTLAILFAGIVNADKRAETNIIEILPADYGKFGLTPIVGLVDDDGMQQTTLVFNKEIHGREISKVELLFYSSKKDLILGSEARYECKQEKCFTTISIIPDYQFNIEFEFIYGKAGINAESKEIRYRIKDIGMLTGRLNRKH